MSDGEQVISLPSPIIEQMNVTMPMATQLASPPIFASKACGGCNNKGCDSCSNSCSDSCSNSCSNSCSDSCSNSCSNSCSDSCSDSCSSCSSSCDSCSYSCDSCGDQSCKGGCDNKNGGHGGKPNHGGNNGGGGRPGLTTNCHNREIVVDSKCGIDNINASAYADSTKYRTLGFAIGRASTGDTIRLNPGVYTLRGARNKTLSIIGSGPTTEILFGADLQAAVTGGGGDTSPQDIDNSNLYVSNATVNVGGNTRIRNRSSLWITRNTLRSNAILQVDQSSTINVVDNTGEATELPIISADINATGRLTGNRLKIRGTQGLRAAYVTSFGTIDPSSTGSHQIDANEFELLEGDLTLEATVADEIPSAGLEVAGLRRKISVDVTGNIVNSSSSGRVVLLDTSRVKNIDQLIKATVVNNVVSYKNTVSSTQVNPIISGTGLEILSNNNSFNVEGPVYDTNDEGEYLPSKDIIVTDDSYYNGKTKYGRLQLVSREDQEVDFSVDKVIFTGNFDKSYDLPRVPRVRSTNGEYPYRDLTLINRGNGYITFQSRTLTDSDSKSGSKGNNEKCRDFCLGACSSVTLTATNGEWIDTTPYE